MAGQLLRARPARFRYLVTAHGSDKADHSRQIAPVEELQDSEHLWLEHLKRRYARVSHPDLLD